MNCRDTEPLLLAERDGVLTSEQHAALERHVAACPACQQLRSHLAEAMTTFRADAAKATVPDVDEAWRTLRAQMHGEKPRPAKKRPLAPIIWFGAPLAAAAALALAYLGLHPKSIEPVAAASAIASVESVDANGEASASTLVYVDKDSGWLVVWAAESGANGKS